MMTTQDLQEEQDHEAALAKLAEHTGPSRWAFRIGMATLVVTLIGLGAGVQYVWSQSHQFDPLGALGGGDYQVQVVQNAVPDVEGPAIVVPAEGVTHVTLLVSGSKCNNSEQTVTVRGSKYWRPVIPSAPVIREDPEPSPGPSRRPPGCVGHTADNPYQNPIPDDVVKAMRRYAQGGTAIQSWVLVGDETPQAADGRIGITRSWQTTNFSVIVR